MTYFPKTAYWITLYPNYESVDKTTNTQFKNTRVPTVAEDEAQVSGQTLFFDMIHYPCVHINLKKYQEVCE